MSLESEFLSLLLKDTLSEDREKGARIRIDIKTSDGKEFHFEKPPMSQERFEAICFLLGGLGAVYFVCKLLSLMISTA